MARRLGAQQHGRAQRHGATGQAMQLARRQLRIRHRRRNGSFHHEELQRRFGSEIIGGFPRRNRLRQLFPQGRHFPKRHPGRVNQSLILIFYRVQIK